ncbi:hypothetical protein [Thiolapillus brandeum]|uniref:hypothetical protein n=1 Tax=Thiolapillus brandeum TaxID=1076588 RepID=UPI000596D46C|nr:hypothetical protein [Thiolapillus brandeum]
MKIRLILTQILWLLAACDSPPDQTTPAPQEPWSTEAEEVFQAAEVLKYEVEQQRLETEKLRTQGVEGAPPALRR